MISVVIPYYNAEKFIHRCLDSLISQSGKFEFIFVNDFSTDSSEDIVKSFADYRCVCIQNKHNKGVSGARNTGIDYAKGKYITFLDSDDVFLPDAYSKFRSVLDVKANCYQFNHLRHYSTKSKSVMKYTNKDGWYNISNLPNCWFGVWNKMFRTSFIKDLRFNESLQYGEDGLFVLEYLLKDQDIYHAEYNITIVKHYFENKQSLSHSKTPEDVLKQIRAYEDFLFKQTSQDMKIVVSREIAILWNRISQLLRKK